MLRYLLASCCRTLLAGNVCYTSARFVYVVDHNHARLSVRPTFTVDICRARVNLVADRAVNRSISEFDRKKRGG